MISIHSDPGQWQTGEKIVWGAVGAAVECHIAIRQRRLELLKEIIRMHNNIMGIETIEEESTRLSFNAEIVLSRLQGEKIRMDTDRHIAGITELAKKGIIEYNKKRRGWRIKA